MSLLFNALSRFIIAFLPRSTCLLISWLQSPSAVILEPKKRKSVTTSTFSSSVCHAVMGLDTMILVFLIFSLKLAHSFSAFTLIKKLFSSSLLSAIRVVSFAYLGFPCGSAGKESACNKGDLGSIPGLERSPGEGRGYPLQYSGLENSMDYIQFMGSKRVLAWLSNFHFTSHPHIWDCWCFSCLSWFQLVTHPVLYFSWCAQRIG